MTTPLVSICIPNLNSRPFLEERMESILAQSLVDWELIVCDSYSDDGAWEFFQKFSSDRRVHLFQVPRKGVIAGVNECLVRAKGKYIYIAPSDDTATPQILESLTTPLERYSEIKIAVCDFHYIDEHSRILPAPSEQRCSFLGDWVKMPSIRNGKTEFLLHAVYNTTIWQAIISVLFRRDLLEQTGLFREELGPRADEEWTLRASLASDIAWVPGSLGGWRRHPNQATPQHTPADAYRLLLLCLESVIHDPGAGIPAAWKEVKGWDRLITGARRELYHESCGLFRWAARQDPKRFIKNVCDALREDRKYLLYQICTGFTWPELQFSDRQKTAHELVKRFNASWPPKAIPGGW